MIFAAASFVEVDVEWNEYLWTRHSNFDEAKARLDQTIEEIRAGLNGDKMIVALSDEAHRRWRPRVMPTYKANRKGTRKPVVYGALRQYVHEVYETYQRPTLEGDDVLGILVTHPKLVTGEKIVVAIDKDMKTLPGLHLNYDHARGAEDYESHIYAITKEQADQFHLLQTIAGDATDGYAGAPGFGMTRAAALLDEGCILEPHEHTFVRGPRQGQKEIRWEKGAEGTPWQIVVSAYASVGLSEEVALMNARVARICRVEDYDFATKEVVLWTPES